MPGGDGSHAQGGRRTGPQRHIQGLRTRAGICFPARGDSEARLHAEGNKARPERDFHQRRCQERHGKHTGAGQVGQQHRRDRPHISGIYRLERDDRTGGTGGKRQVEQRDIHAVHGREQLRAADTRPTGRHYIPLLSKQPDGHGDIERRAAQVGELRIEERHAHILRRGIRGLHTGRRHTPLHI